MNVDEFARLVLKMRVAQRAYFRSLTTAALNEAVRRERAVDRAVTDVMTRPMLPTPSDPPEGGAR